MEILKNKEKKWRLAALILVVVFALSFITIPFLGIASLLLISPLGFAVWSIGLIYLIQYFPLIPNLRKLERIGKSNVADDISANNRLSPKSKLYCGAFAIACTNPCIVIPYSEIAWIYIYKQTAFGAVTTYQSAIIYCTDGTKYSISATPDEAQQLLNKYIIPQSPNVVVGYGSEQKKLFLSRNPQAVQAQNKVKFVWGVVLLLLGALMVFACVINHPVAIPAYILTAAALIGGTILLLLGKRK